MQPAVIPVFGSRPAVLTQNGVVVYVSLHDAAYLRKLDEWKLKLRTAHPDTGGTEAKFRTAWKSFQRWKGREKVWYAHYGLEPPAPSDRDAIPAPPPSPKAERLKRSLGNQWQVKAILAGNCRRCGKPRGGNGTSQMCRDCADVHAERMRDRTRAKGVVVHSRRKYHTSLPPGPRAIVAVLTIPAEKRIWEALAHERRMSVSHLVRETMRERFAYPTEVFDA